MNAVITCEHHFVRDAGSGVWTDGQLPYAFWTRYLSVFDSVRVLARVRDATFLLPGLQPASGPNVTFSAVADYRGPEQYMLQIASVAAATAKAVQNSDAVILRVPGRLGSCVEGHLRKMKRPYAVEVVGDPYDVFAPQAVRHPFRPFFRWWFTRSLRRQCAGACAAAYVTRHALQRRYSPNPKAFSTHYSSIELPKTAFVSEPRSSPPNGAAKLIFVGTLAQLYKAPDILIDAVAECVRDGLNVELVLVGSGRCQPELESRAAALGLRRRIRFRGQLTTAEAVRGELDRADLFVLPSRQEGLPRAMIEAMARALPCIGSTVGGFPELVPAQDLVAPGDAAALARKIREVIADPDRIAQMSARNLAKAMEYSDATLSGRRQEFYRHLKMCNEAWILGRQWLR
jgi:glycosyltransferase involved in cell wall biosynthesis